MQISSRGSIEAAIAAASVRFQREQQGRGPAEVRAHLLGDMVLVRSTGIFTQTEGHLAGSEEGRRLIKSARHELRSINHLEIESIVAGLVGCPVLRSFYDVDVREGEQMEVFVLAWNLEKQFCTC